MIIIMMGDEHIMVNYNSPFFTILHIILETLCIVVFFIASIRCLQSAYAHYINGQMLWVLWLAIGGVVLIVISFGGAIDLYKRAFHKDQ